MEAMNNETHKYTNQQLQEEITHLINDKGICDTEIRHDENGYYWRWGGHGGGYGSTNALDALIDLLRYLDELLED